jgi:hypothetical protein
MRGFPGDGIPRWREPRARSNPTASGPTWGDFSTTELELSRHEAAGAPGGSGMGAYGHLAG